MHLTNARGVTNPAHYWIIYELYHTTCMEELDKEKRNYTEETDSPYTMMHEQEKGLLLTDLSHKIQLTLPATDVTTEI